VEQQRVFLIAGSPEMDIKFVEMISSNWDKSTAVYAIDIGLEICHQLNISVIKIIGDLDSVNPQILNQYPEALIQRFHPEKDFSDTELAINIALENGYDDIVILNANGGRIDHFLINCLMLLKSPCKIKILTPRGIIWALSSKFTSHYEFKLPKNSLFSLIPWGECQDVSISGAQYPLVNKTLLHSSLTLSNLSTAPLTIHIGKGDLFFFTAAWKSVLSSSSDYFRVLE
jgi:thiamine pyrophosphokinase